MFLLQIDFETRVLTYCNAGHPAALYAVTGSDGQILPLRTGGPILGAVSGAIYRASRLRPVAGDVVLLYTDGLSETMDEAGNEFATTRLHRLLQDLAGLKPRKIVEEVIRTVADFRGNADRVDDIALAALKFGEAW
jgi:sigma-B regulation protein RsbU (phosphoserine phosphatase)